MIAAPLVLSLETATLGGSVAIVRAGEVLACSTGDPQTSHSNTLLSDINEALTRARVSLEEIDLFAAASGPGSFTGLRIGLATIKGLGATLGRPCVGIPTLQAIARAAGFATATVALLAAGRGEVFAQLFSVSASGTMAELDEPAHLPPQRMLDRYRSIRNLIWAGEGAHVHRETISAEAERNGIPFRDSGAEPGESGWVLSARENNLAREVAALALLRYERGETESPQALRAIYVRPSDAELKVKC